MKSPLPLLFASFISSSTPAQINNPATQTDIQSYYRLALQYKDGNGVPMDYAKAYNYFEKAASLGDAQSTYALGYMHYKGLGCAQDYTKAAGFFKQGALQGRDNSMYFYALCWRNGYGVAKNEDSARYWLKKADELGYAQAAQELKMTAGENSNDSAKALVRQINNAAIPVKAPVNQYKKLTNNLPSAEALAGRYSGYLIQYDWSGQNVVSSRKLQLSLRAEKGSLAVTWLEEGADSVMLIAFLKATALVFDNTQYQRTDHYSPDKGVQYQFQDANLNLVQQDNILYLAGNVTMFSPERKEPSKPLFVALSRTDVNFPDPTIMTLKVNPNPFTDVLNVDFQLVRDANVEIQLLDASGAILYRNNAGHLRAGHYLLPLQPGIVAAGSYLLKLIYAGKTASVKVIKY